jgi:hypothetical protein
MFIGEVMDLDEVLNFSLSFKAFRQQYYSYLKFFFIIGVFNEGLANFSKLTLCRICKVSEDIELGKM